MKMKQVHAQRKYAQGVHIPISNINPPERRLADVSGQQTSQIYYNNNNAKNLLDVVSFSNIHKHRQPIVLIERLETTYPSLIKEQNNKVKTNDSNVGSGFIKRSQSTPHENSSRKRRVTRVEQEPIPSTSGYKTRRSKRLCRTVLCWNDIINTRDTNKPKTVRNKRKMGIVKKTITRVKTTYKSAIGPFISSLPADDDEMPLTYFKNKTAKEMNNTYNKSEKRKASCPSLIKSSKPKNTPGIQDTLINEVKESTVNESGIQNTLNNEVKESTVNGSGIQDTLINEVKESTINGSGIQDTLINEVKESTVNGSGKEKFPESTTFKIENTDTANISNTLSPMEGIEKNIYEPEIQEELVSSIEKKDIISAMQNEYSMCEIKETNTNESESMGCIVKVQNYCNGDEPQWTNDYDEIGEEINSNEVLYEIENGIQVTSENNTIIEGAYDTYENLYDREAKVNREIISGEINSNEVLYEIENGIQVTSENNTIIEGAYDTYENLYDREAKVNREIISGEINSNEVLYEIENGIQVTSENNTIIEGAYDTYENLYDREAKVNREIISGDLCNPQEDPQEGPSCSSVLPDAEVKVEDEVFLISDEDTKDIKTEDHVYPSTSTGITHRKRRLENSIPMNFDKMVNAPVFNPTIEEFADPIAYFEKVMPLASKFGICKIVPPDGFKPSCHLSEKNKFHVSNQYISRLYTRWGPAIREMCAIRLHLSSQEVNFTRSPLINGLEVDLPKLFHTVQRLGGLKNFSDKKKWSRVSEEMNFSGLRNPSKKLDHIYVKFLLPYDTLKNKERHEKIVQVEEMWYKKNKRMLARAINPLHRQKRLLGESDTDDELEGTSDVMVALAEAEDCIVEGRQMNVQCFENVAQCAAKFFLPPNTNTSTSVIEELYWKTVLLGSEHVCVNSASVDTGEEGYGFTLNKVSPDGVHPWNLKVLSQNKGNVLRPLGRILGLTVPTLHLGMVFSTSCWHRDPHGLPWIEYMHKGPDKIWYGIPDDQSENFQKAMETLYPTACQNKGIWLPSDITMVPPNLLLGHNVSMSKLIQKPGEFVIVFPKAYSSSICTGYTVSESVYFGTKSWFNTMVDVFQELRDSCEPTTFALEQLLIAIARDTDSPDDCTVLEPVHSALEAIVAKEISNRAVLRQYGLPFSTGGQPPNTLQQDNECDICRRTLHLSRVTGVFGRDSTLCLEHAIRVLVGEQRRSKRKGKKKQAQSPRVRSRDSKVENIEQRVEFFITDKELQDIVHNIKQRLLKTVIVL